MNNIYILLIGCLIYCISVNIYHYRLINSNIVNNNLKKEKYKTSKNIENFESKKINEDYEIINFIINSNTVFKNNPYLGLMNQINIQARGFDNKQQCFHKYYNQSLAQISESDKDNVYLFINDLLDILDTRSTSYKKYIEKLLKTIKIGKANQWLEGGMPHTHKNIIIMDQPWFKNPRLDTLIHEMTHVDQRYNSNLYADLYEEWGFRYYNKQITGLENKYLLSRHNPDGMDLNWIWNNHNKAYWITAEYTNIESPNIHNVLYQAYPLHGGVSDDYYYTGSNPIELKNFKEFQEYFNLKNNHYHPNEISANYSEFYMFSKTQGNYTSPNNKGYQIYKKHMDNYIEKL